VDQIPDDADERLWIEIEGHEVAGCSATTPTRLTAGLPLGASTITIGCSCPSATPLLPLSRHGSTASPADEPAFIQPAVVVSVDVLNNGPGEVVAVVPLGSKAYGLRSHVEIATGAIGLDHLSYARGDQVRTISTRRLVNRRGVADRDEMLSIDQTLRFVLDL